MAIGHETWLQRVQLSILLFDSEFRNAKEQLGLKGSAVHVRSKRYGIAHACT